MSAKSDRTIDKVVKVAKIASAIMVPMATTVVVASVLNRFSPGNGSKLVRFGSKAGTVLLSSAVSEKVTEHVDEFIDVCGELAKQTADPLIVII